MFDDLLSITEAAKRAGVVRSRIYQLLDDGTLETVTISGKKFVRASELDARQWKTKGGRGKRAARS